MARPGLCALGRRDGRRAEAALAADLRSGEWDRRHGHLRELESLDVGLRLVVDTTG
ncbi:MAG: hypothetical protein ACXVRW_19140 [Solirubrobacteraceae bacterium]